MNTKMGFTATQDNVIQNEWYHEL